MIFEDANHPGFRLRGIGLVMAGYTIFGQGRYGRRRNIPDHGSHLCDSILETGDRE